MCPCMCSCPCSCPPCVDAMCTRGPVPHAHMCTQPCASLSSLIVPLSGSCLGGCWAGHWPYWYMSPLTLSLHVLSWSSPPGSLLCLGMCGSMSKIFSALVAGVCLCMCSIIGLGICVNSSTGVQGVSGCGWCASGGRECVSGLLGTLLYVKHLWGGQV